MIRPMVIVFGTLMAGAALAKAPETSLRPVARPGTVETAVPLPAPDVAISVVRPRARPDRAPAAEDQADPAVLKASPVAGADPVPQQGAGDAPVQTRAQEPRIGLLRSLRPLLRPRDMATRAVARKPQETRGSVCGDPAIQGSVVGPVAGSAGGCGVEEAVKVRAINGIVLSQQAVMDCRTARTLKKWMQTGMTPAIGGTGGGVARITVAAHYACRTRNNQKGTQISEHGKGRAIDIAAFQLHDGTEISVLNDWGRGRNGKVLRRLQDSACGPFGTVLGPNSDRFHQDHFHFDTADYRRGSYCR